MHPITKAIRLQTPRSGEMEHATPLFLTSSFCFDTAEEMRAAFADEQEANIYSRFTNPNVKELTDKMAALEGAEAACATASGMSAISSLFLALLQQGDHILCSNAVFGSTHTVLAKYMPRYGISHTLFDPAQPDTWEAAVKPSTRMIFVETPSNPGLDILDLSRLDALAKKHQLLFVVDNCFATPVAQQPIRYGADLVVHSGTKWLDGQGRVLAGIIAGKQSLVKEIFNFGRSMGPALSPFNAWVLSKSLETLDVRMERHAANALYLAEQLEAHEAIKQLRYPFLPSHPQYETAKKQMSNGGGLFCFELKGGLDAGRAFLDKLQLLSLTANLGDTRSIASHPASTTHAKLTEAERLTAGITPGLIRISVGLEHRDDILADILQALS